MEARTKRNTIKKDYRERKRVKVKATEPSSTSHIDNTDNVVLQLRQLLKEIKELKDPNDEAYLLSTLFLDKPSKKHYPDYYKVIKQPIALSDMENKINQNIYKSIDQFKADIALMVTNANTYNEPNSQVYNDALHIQKYVDNWLPPNNNKREKAVLKLPGEAFNTKTIKTIKLKAVDKHKPSLNMLALMESIHKKDQKKAIDIFDKDKQLDPNELVETEMFGDKFTWAPLHAAAYYGHVKLMPYLLERKGNVELHDTWHSATPLGWAAFGDRDKMVKLLVQKYHANVKAKNKHGQVPYDVVSDQKDERWNGLFKQVSITPPTQIHIHKPNIQKKQELPPAHHIVIPTSLQPSNKTVTIGNDKTNIPAVTPIHVPTAALNASITPASGTISSTTANISDMASAKKRRGRPPKSETDLQDVRPTKEIDITTFDPVAFEIELFNAIRTHTDNTNRLYSELFEDLPDRTEYPDYYNVIREPRSLSEIAEKMSTRQYVNLHQWMTDMKLVFDNALSYNETKSRIFRDAKLLKRLLHRLKERILARLQVPVSQEDDIMRLDLMSRPFDPYLLSEDKRKSKRIINKSRTQSIEPQDYLMPVTTTSATNITTTTLPLLNNMPLPMMPIQPTPPLLDPTLLTQNNPMLLAAMTGNPDIMNLAATAAAASVAAAADPSTVISPLSTESYKLIKEQGRCLDRLQLSTSDNAFELEIDCHLVGHSVTVPSEIERITIKPKLPNQDERNRFSIMIFHNNIQLSPQQDMVWITTPLVKGMNVIKISVTVNLTQPDSNIPDFKSQLYHVFVQQIW